MDRSGVVDPGATVAQMDPYPTRDYDPIQPRGTNWRALGKRISGPVVAGGIAVAKWSFLLVKFGSIFVAIGGYALLSGWTFAIGFVLMLLAHETGHFLEARREGLHPRLPVFIPFLAAYVRYTRGNPWQTARIAIAGPIFGGLASLVLLLVAHAEHSAVLHYVAYWGFLLNLLNLLPFGIFDGGAVWRSADWLRRGGGADKALIAYLLYFGTAALLVVGMAVSYVPQHRL
jgi:Zn-dependent protease